MQNSTNAPQRSKGLGKLPALSGAPNPSGAIVYIDPNGKPWRIDASGLIANNHTAGVIPHGTPGKGDTWWNTTDETLSIYASKSDTGTPLEWIVLTPDAPRAQFSIGAAPHADPLVGDMWKDTADDTWYTYVPNGPATFAWVSL